MFSSYKRDEQLEDMKEGNAIYNSNKRQNTYLKVYPERKGCGPES